jgi:hypothetical protein
MKKQPSHFNDCIIFARIKFEKYFVNNIKQLIYTYPLDLKTKEGNLFWSFPKRPPQPLIFDENNKVHVDMIASMACLRAKLYNITIPENPRSTEVIIKILLKYLDEKEFCRCRFLHKT